MANTEIVALAKKSINGNKKAFEELCRKKQQEIVFSAYTMLGNYHDAEDATQETIISMFRHIGKLKSPEAIDAWIFQIVKSKCSVILRKRTGRKDEIDIDDEAVSIAEDDREFLPAEYVEDEAQSDHIYKIVTALPEKRREAILMYYYEDMSYREIADATGTSIKTVSANISKARAMIKKQLNSENSNNGAVLMSAGAGVAGTGAGVGAGVAGVGVAGAGTGGSHAVLGQILRRQADKHISQEYLTTIEHRWQDSIKTKKFHASQSSWIIKGVACVAAVVMVFAGAVYFSGGFGGADTPETTSGDILKDRGMAFTGGHINPTGATVTNLKEGDKNAEWEITDTATKELIYTGTGTEATSTITEMVKSGMGGSYTLLFRLDDKDGNHIKLSNKFKIEDPASADTTD
jgi:RNA polymerase sigma-70 factor (ECF subfamily)